MRNVRGWLVGVGLPVMGFALGCSSPGPEPMGPVTPLPTAASAAPQASPVPPLPVEGEPLVFGASASAAPWVEPRLDYAEDPKLEADGSVLGVKAALVHTNLGVFLHHRERGVSGPLALPEPPRAGAEPDVGLGKGDEVLYAGPSGRVFGAADAQASLIARGSVPGAERWDFAPGLVVASRGDTVFASTDGGKTFHSSTPKRGAPVTEVFARFDGVIVAGTEDGTFVSRDHGKRWAASLLAGTVERTGAWVSICSHVLAKDGRHWLELEWPDVYDVAWGAPMSLDDHPRALGLRALFTAVVPAPPVAPPNAGEGEIHVGCSGPHGGRPHRGGRLPSVRIGTALQWKPFGLKRLAGTLGPATEPTRSHFAFLGDGACDPAEAGESYACRADAKIVRPAHLASIDRTTLATSVFEVPARCNAIHVREAMGLGVIGCRVGPGEISLELASRTGVGPHETDLRVAGEKVPELIQAADGSLLVPAAEGSMKVLVRRPIAVGAPDAWRAVAIDGAIAYRITAGGVVLAVVAPSAEATAFDLVRDDGRGPPSVIARAASVYGGVDDVTIDQAGRVLVSVRDGAGDRHGLWVGKGGALVRAKP